MKVYIESGVLTDPTVREIFLSAAGRGTLRVTGKPSQLSFWTSSISVSRLYRAGNLRTPRSFLKSLVEAFAVIPCGKGILEAALAHENMDLLGAVELASAEAFCMDCIVAARPEEYQNERIPVFSPEMFTERWKAGEFDEVTHTPFLDLKAQHSFIYNEIEDRITEIINSNGFILGRHVQELETRFAEMHEVTHCLGVSTGTDALHIALMALGIGQGDAVIVPVNTFIATAEAVSMTGAVPVFMDCNEYCNLDAAKLRNFLETWQSRSQSITIPGGWLKTIRSGLTVKAVIPVHLYGQPANMDAIKALAKECDLVIIEDACQAHLARWGGKRVGNFGAFGAFSFYPGKNLGAYGEAGALVTGDEELYRKARMIRQHGEIERYHHHVIGHNYRMEAIQGAVLCAKLPHLENWTECRRANAKLYNELLMDVAEVRTPGDHEKSYSVYHLYVIQAENRDGLQRYLQEKNIGTGLHYPVPLHLQPAYAFLGYGQGDFPVAEAAAKKILSLPMYPELTEKQIQYVVEAIKAFYAKHVSKSSRSPIISPFSEPKPLNSRGAKSEACAS